MKKVLVTAFEPYDRWKTNASWLALVHLTQDLPSEPIVTTRLYPVDFAAVRRKLAEDLEGNYDYALHLGQAPGSGRIQLEAVGINIGGSSSQSPDQFRPLVDDGPVAYRSELPLGEWSMKLRRAGIPAQVSYHAGTHLCNATLYLSCHLARQMSLSTQPGFVHVPLDLSQTAGLPQDLPALSAATSSAALRIILEDLRAERDKPSDPTLAVRSQPAVQSAPVTLAPGRTWLVAALFVAVAIAIYSNSFRAPLVFDGEKHIESNPFLREFWPRYAWIRGQSPRAGLLHVRLELCGRWTRRAGLSRREPGDPRGGRAYFVRHRPPHLGSAAARGALRSRGLWLSAGHRPRLAGPSAGNRERDLSLSALRIADGTVLLADAVQFHPQPRLAVADVVASRGRDRLCLRHGLQGSDGHRTAGRAVVQPRVRRTVVARDRAGPVAVLRRARGDVGLAGFSHARTPRRVRPDRHLRGRRRDAAGLRPDATRRDLALFKALFLARRALFGLRLAGGPPCRPIRAAAGGSGRDVDRYGLARFSPAALGFSGGHVFSDPGPDFQHRADRRHGFRASHVSAAGLRRGAGGDAGLRARRAARAVFLALPAGRWAMFAAALAAPVAVLGVLTYLRNQDYASRASIWSDTVAKSPENLRARHNLGLALLAEDHVPAAFAQFEAMMELQARRPPTIESVGLIKNVAWMRATSPTAAWRDGPEAVRLATRAVRLSRSIGVGEPECLDTLAAAFAQAGRFDDAVITAEKAVDLARRQNNSKVVREASERLALYRAGRPFRDVPISPNAKTAGNTPADPR